MSKFILIFLSFSFFAFAEAEQILEEPKESSADCLILEDENSIICKYLHKRMEEDKEFNVQWINPNGDISRERTLILPAGHGSIYDFRYIEGRMKGIWQFKVIDGQKEITTKFSLD